MQKQNIIDFGNMCKRKIEIWQNTMVAERGRQYGKKMNTFVDNPYYHNLHISIQEEYFYLYSENVEQIREG